MSIDISQPIGEITKALPAASRVFERLGIDYCCQGKRTLSEACAARGLALPDVLAQLETMGLHEQPKAPLDDVLALIEHIEQTHHVLTRAELARLRPLAEKVRRVHGGNHPEVVRVHQLFEELAAELTPHMFKEERVLFPHIRSLAQGQPGNAPFPTVRAPIQVMSSEHDRVGSLLSELSTVTSGYTPPTGACASYRALYDGLSTLQTDIHEHVHLENNVLFPAAEALEAGLSP